MSYPWTKFFPRDWMGDAELSACSPAARGIWMDWLCAMHAADRCGVLAGSAEVLARLGRCAENQAVAALAELAATGAADVETHADGTFIVANRRMRREYDVRKSSAARMQKARERKRVALNVTATLRQGCAEVAAELQPGCASGKPDGSDSKPAEASAIDATLQTEQPDGCATVTVEKLRRQKLTPTPLVVAQQCTLFLEHKCKAAGGPSVAGLELLIKDHGVEAVIHECERRVEMREPWRGLDRGPIAAMRAAILKGEKPAKPGTFETYLAWQKAKTERKADQQAQAALQARAAAFRESYSRAEREALCAAFQAQVRQFRALQAGDVIAARVDVADVAEDFEAVAAWAETAEGRAVLESAGVRA